ncbi:hypothetical protein D3C71_2076450 [compost metagenome]
MPSSTWEPNMASTSQKYLAVARIDGVRVSLSMKSKVAKPPSGVLSARQTSNSRA